MKRKNKAAPQDFTEAMLPQSRKAIFFDVLKLQWRKLLLLGAILLVFSLPLLLSDVIAAVYSTNYIAAAEQIGLAVSYDAAGGLIRFELIRSAVNIVLLLIFLVGLSGALRVLRQLAWEENVYLPTEFPAGIKSNYGQLALLGILCGVIAVLCKGVLFFSVGYRSGMSATLSLVPLAASILLLLPAMCLCLAMIPVYANPLRANLKNAFYVYFSSLLRVLGTLLACAAFWLPMLIPDLMWHCIGHAFAFLTLPVTLLAWMLFCFTRFDVSINAAQCPELTGKGIFRPQEENTPADEQ